MESERTWRNFFIIMMILIFAILMVALLRDFYIAAYKLQLVQSGCTQNVTTIDIPDGDGDYDSRWSIHRQVVTFTCSR